MALLYFSLIQEVGAQEVSSITEELTNVSGMFAAMFAAGPASNSKSVAILSERAPGTPGNSASRELLSIAKRVDDEWVEANDLDTANNMRLLDYISDGKTDYVLYMTHQSHLSPVNQLCLCVVRDNRPSVHHISKMLSVTDAILIPSGRDRVQVILIAAFGNRPTLTVLSHEARLYDSEVTVKTSEVTETSGFTRLFRNYDGVALMESGARGSGVVFRQLSARGKADIRVPRFNPLGVIQVEGSVHGAVLGYDGNNQLVVANVDFERNDIHSHVYDGSTLADTQPFLGGLLLANGQLIVAIRGKHDAVDIVRLSQLKAGLGARLERKPLTLPFIRNSIRFSRKDDDIFFSSAISFYRMMGLR